MKIVCTITSAVAAMCIVTGCGNQSTAPGSGAEAAVEEAKNVVVPDGMKNIDSSVIKAVRYQAETKQMQILFPSGDTYTYEGVEQSMYDGLMSAKSKGTYYQENIKGKFGSE